MTDEIESAVDTPHASVLYLDEAGDPTLFAKGGKVVADTEGCSRFFILGKLEVMDAAALETDLAALRADILSDPYFKGVPSFEPERNKTAVAFHAKNDRVLPAAPPKFHRCLCNWLRCLQEIVQSLK